MENPTSDDPTAESIELTQEQLREFVRTSAWQFAKTMPATPHEYTLRQNAPDRKRFEEVVLYIRQEGYKAKYGKTTYTYLDIDGWQYWTMGAPLNHPSGEWCTVLINRARIAR